MKNVIIDSFNRASTAEWQSAMDTFKGQSDLISKAMVEFENFNNFLGLNIANSPSFTIKTALADKHFLLIIGALMIPVLAALTQWINTKLMPQPENSNAQTDQMAATMKSMNVMMPLMSAFFCYTMPIGMGIYWIAGAVVRCIQQIVINKHIDKMDIDEIIEKNSAKAEKKIKKQQENIQRMNEYATMNTRNMGIGDRAKLANNASDNGKNANDSVAGDFTKTVNAKPGSLAAKANMVTDYNNRK